MSAQQDLTRISRLLDAGVPDPDSEGQMWHRVAKVAEESGEAIEAMIGHTARNPRKGHSHDAGHLVKELLDTAVSALGAVEHIHGNPDEGIAFVLLAEHLAFVKERIEP